MFVCAVVGLICVVYDFSRDDEDVQCDDARSKVVGQPRGMCSFKYFASCKEHDTDRICKYCYADFACHLCLIKTDENRSSDDQSWCICRACHVDGKTDGPVSKRLILT